MLFLSKIYKNYLVKKIDKSKLPLHLAIIPDGNRRWARKRGYPPWYGHFVGASVLESIVELAFELGVKYVTVFTMSVDNFSKRSKEEVDNLLKLLNEKLDEILSEKYFGKLNDVKMRFIGFLSKLPNGLIDKIKKVEEKYSKGSRVLSLAICYGGQEDIINAVNEILENNLREVTKDSFKNFLFTRELPPVDLLIRTGKERRISNFLLWDLAYSELYFSDKLFPEFSEIDLLKALIWFQKRERRFGR